MKKNIRDLIIYGVVGGLATLVEWAFFRLFNASMGLHYELATTFAYIISTFANWGFGKLLLFREKQNVWKELGKIYLTSIVGWLLNLLIMWVLVSLLSSPEMLAKIVATGLVFIWNFLIRKLVIYKNS